MKEEYVEDDEDVRSQEITIFEVELIASHYMGAAGVYRSDLQVNGLKHMFFADCVIPFWREGLSPCYTLGRVNYMGVPDAACKGAP